MGGLRKSIPLVYACFPGGAAPSALPLVTAGFSKYEILGWREANGHINLMVAGLPARS
ncbi:hypothetical protein KCP71_15050 [Salmonella enterica subsp. enterica]|nr:hypothetical protein KCP71_15050 [Salmonella enterica subsp. enterica]